MPELCDSCGKCVSTERDGFLAKVNLKENCAVIHAKAPVSEEELRRIIQKSGYSVRSVVTRKAG